MAEVAKYLLFSLFVASYAVYGLVGPRIFLRSRGPTHRLLVGSLISTAAVGVQAYSLLTHVATSGVMICAAITAYVGALALFACACRATRARRLPIAFDPALPQDIIVAGPYRYVRHPFYVSYSLTLLAGALSTTWWPAWLMAGFICVSYVRVALSEERRLLATHADAYERYRRRTGAFIPRIFVP